ncbi:MAG: hypothetical protein V4555_16420, partial [Acidobacteriota bacterium]
MRVFGSTKEEALARAEHKFDELRQHGHAQSSISPTLRSIMVEWRERLTPEQMVAAFVAYQEAQGCTRRVRECVADYVAAKTKPDDRGKCAWSKEQEKPAGSRLKRFVEVFGKRIMGQVSPGELEDFVSAQNGSSGNYHRVLRALFSHARRHRWIAKTPFEEMGKARESDGESKDLMEPGHFAKLLRIAAGLEDGHARKEPLLAAFILGGLAGLRTAEAQRLTWGQVDLKAGRVSLNRITTRKKGLRGRYVDLEPAARAWMRTLTPGEPGARV